ncbi:hypothetical protein BH18ACT15_BH18ACT15_01890 [soil metagenome]
MSIEQLVSLDERRAFEATHRFEDLDLLHVPFDDLTGRPATEAVLTRMAGRAGRVAVVGGSGSGKSSVMASVLGPLADELPESVVPLRIPVAGEPDATVTEPHAFAGHLITVITRWASPELFTPAQRESLELAAAERRARFGKQTARKFNLGTPGWLADARFAVEVQAAGEEVENRVSTADAVFELARMFELFRAHGLEPLVVIDDSDTWLRVPEWDRSELAAGFFTENVRMLAKDLDCGFVLAVHTEYLDIPAYRASATLLSTTIPIPRFEPGAAEAIARILEHRIAVQRVEAELGDVLESEALRALEEHYYGGAKGSLRNVLNVVDRALQHACSDGSPRITKQLVAQGLSEWH